MYLITHVLGVSSIESFWKYLTINWTYKILNDILIFVLFINYIVKVNMNSNFM